jgi:hypothetical protein
VFQESKPKLFIGSARESKKYAAAIHRELRRCAEVTPWYAGVFGPNRSTMEDLEEQLDQSDFGVFVFSPDDVVTMRGKRMLVPRDNTVFEMGLFWGKLRRERVFFIVPEASGASFEGKELTEFHIPSDLHGLTLLTYEVRPEQYDAAVSIACDTISEKIESLRCYQHPQQASMMHFLIDFTKEMLREPERKYEFLADAIRIAYDTSKTGHKVTGAAIWKVDGADGLRQVGGNIGRNKFYPFTVNDGKQEGEPRVLVVDAYLTSTQQVVLYKKHVANVYLLCYPVGEELVITIHLSGRHATAAELGKLMDSNEGLLSTIHYLFGGEST